MRFLALVAVLALTGCGTIRSLVGPDPALVAAKPVLNRGLATDTAVNPEHKPENDKAGAALGDATDPAPSPIPGILTVLIAALGGPAGVGTLAVAGAAGVTAYLNRKKVIAVESAVDQHATLIDSVTPESADFAAKAKTKAKAAPPSA